MKPLSLLKKLAVVTFAVNTGIANLTPFGDIYSVPVLSDLTPVIAYNNVTNGFHIISQQQAHTNLVLKTQLSKTVTEVQEQLAAPIKEMNQVIDKINNPPADSRCDNLPPGAQTRCDYYYAFQN